MLKLDNCVVADYMVDRFTQLDIHKKSVNEVLQSRLGEHADVSTKTIANECGGNMILEFGIYDITEEILNFSDMISNKIDITEDVVKSTLSSYLESFNVTVDIEWSEEPSKNEVNIFLGSDNFRNLKSKYESEKIRFEVLDALENSIKDFVDSTLTEASNKFTKCWVYEYNYHLDEE